MPKSEYPLQSRRYEGPSCGSYRVLDRLPQRPDPTYGKCRPPRAHDLSAPQSACALEIPRAAFRKRSFLLLVAAPMSDRARCRFRLALPFRTTTTSNRRPPCPESRRQRRCASLQGMLPATAFPEMDRLLEQLVVFQVPPDQTPRKPLWRRGCHHDLSLLQHTAQGS